MKKSVLIVACGLSVIAYGAEKAKCLELSIGGTSFQIIKDDMYKHDASVDLMFVGINQQGRMGHSHPESNQVGWIKEFKKNKVRVLQDADNSSDDDRYEPWPTIDLSKKAEDKFLNCKVFGIAEPCVMYDVLKYKKPKMYGYFPSRPHPEKDNWFLNPRYFKEEAISEACKDLKVCYSNCLQHGFENLGDKDNKKIALASLGADTGVPRGAADLIAFNAIVKFLTCNPGKYSSVQLFIKKCSEYVLFRELVEQYLESQQ